MQCQECGLPADERASGWRAYRTDLLAERLDEVPLLVFYCGECAVREFGPKWAASRPGSAWRRVAWPRSASPATELRGSRSKRYWEAVDAERSLGDELDNAAAHRRYLPYPDSIMPAAAEADARGVLSTASFLVLIAVMYLVIGFALGKWV